MAFRKCMPSASMLVTMLILAGCSGGDSGDSVQASNLSVLGVWEGQFLGDPFGAETAVLVIQGDRFMMVDNNNVVYDGSFALVSRTSFLAQQVRRVNAAGQNMAMLSISGSVESDNRFGQLLRITMTALNSPNVPSNLQMQPSATYLEPASLSRVADTWVDSSNLSSPYTLTISDVGSTNVFAQDLVCTHNGVVSVPSAQRNLYAMSVFIGGCALNGQYTGFATLQNENVMRLMLANQSHGLGYTPVRQ